jgi:hypothetical protein
MSSSEEISFSPRSHNVEDVYKVVEGTDQSIRTMAVKHHQFGNRLDEIQVAQDLAVGRLHRVEEAQREQSAKMDQLLALLADKQ